MSLPAAAKLAFSRRVLLVPPPRWNLWNLFSYFTEIRNDINQRREEFIKFLQDRNFSVFPSRINAMLLKFDDEDAGTKFANYLLQNSFIVTHGNGNSNLGLDKSFVRIAVGTKDQMEKLKKPKNALA